MKKILSGILALACSAGMICSVSAEESNVIYGDINGNGVVDLTDLSYLSLYLLGDCSFTKDQLLAADVDGSGEVNIADLPYLKQYIMHDPAVLHLGPSDQNTKTRLSSGDFAAFYLPKLKDVNENTLFVASSAEELKKFSSEDTAGMLSGNGIDVNSSDFFKNNIILFFYPKTESDIVLTLDSIDFDNSSVIMNINKTEAVKSTDDSRAAVITAILSKNYFNDDVVYTFTPEYHSKVVKKEESTVSVSTVTIRTGSYPVELGKKAVAVTSMDEFKKYSSLSSTSPFPNTDINYLSEAVGDLSKDDPDFFNDNILILTTSSASSGSCDANVKKVFVDEKKVTVTLEQKTPGPGTSVTEDLGAWLQVTTVPKSLVEEADLSNIAVETVYKEF